MARRRAWSEVLKDREPLPAPNIAEEPGAAGAIGKTMFLCDDASQPNGMSPPLG
jgi:hypothetical protein